MPARKAPPTRNVGNPQVSIGPAARQASTLIARKKTVTASSDALSAKRIYENRKARASARAAGGIKYVKVIQ